MREEDPRRMTKVERETLQALCKLGRRTGHTVPEITNVRLKIRHTGSKRWDSVPWGQRPSMTNQETAQYYSATGKWLYSFYHRGLVEVIHSRVKAGRSLQFFVGPFFKLTKEGQKLARKVAA